MILNRPQARDVAPLDVPAERAMGGTADPIYRPLPLPHTAAFRQTDHGAPWPIGSSDLLFSASRAPTVTLPRLFSYQMRYWAGLRQWGAQQHFHQLYLPPPVLSDPTMTGSYSFRVGRRSMGGRGGAGTISDSTSHIPSVRVPRTIT